MAADSIVESRSESRLRPKKGLPSGAARSARSVAEYLRSLSEREAEFDRLGAQQHQVQREIEVESFLRFRVQEITSAVMLAALATRQRFGISYWDAAILEAARMMGCDAVPQKT